MRRPTFTARRKLQITAAYDERLIVGFPVTLEGNDETLQIARDVDRTNWLTLLGICDEAIAAGAGDLPIPSPGLRTTANHNYVLTFTDTAALIRELRAWSLAMWANWGRLKDLADVAPDDLALNAIDITEGWP